MRSVWVEEKFHTKLKVDAAKQKITMGELVIKLLKK